MASSVKDPAEPVFLGIECGGTHTVAILATASEELLRRETAGPANLRLLSDRELVDLFRRIHKAMGRPDALGIGMAGARTESDRNRIRKAARQLWPGVPCHATNDLETGLEAASPPPRDRTGAGARRVLVLSGTGSCCFGRGADGDSVKVGGWGHVLGDRGSGFAIASAAVREVIAHYDTTGQWPRLGQRILRALQLNDPEQMIGWSLTVGKTEMAALAVEVFEAAAERDTIARSILTAAVGTLSGDAVACARRLFHKPQPTQFVLAGSVLLKQPAFARDVASRIQLGWPGAVVTPLDRESAWGGVVLARKLAASIRQLPSVVLPDRGQETGPEQPPPDIRALVNSPTEQRNPNSMDLHKLSIGQAIDLMLSEDARIPAAIAAEKPAIERALRKIVSAFERGGRLFYVGAGTSGRLGILDASECPPTFQVSPEMVQGIIAGGQQAIWLPIEGAEDDAEAGAQAISGRGVQSRDVVVGIAASGRTPFVWGALEEAHRRSAATVLLMFNPSLVIPRARRPDVVIAPNVGPEVLTGSTRLKAGTATKLVLNMFTTLAMVRMGKVVSNLMVDVKASNVKLRDRAVRIVTQITGADYAAAQAALRTSRWQVKAACKRLGWKQR